MGLDITGLGSVFDFGSKIIDKIFPDKDAADKAKIALIELQQKGEFKEMDQVFELAKGQLDINKEEAKSGKLLQQWRPALGWVCVIAYFYNFVAGPLLVWTLEATTTKLIKMPALDTSELSVILLGMLGIGGLKTLERVRGVKNV